ncbi:MaoC family dehydratase [Pseudogracilibacillus sp. SE30717A]|uniref:MaoC family dehydratase n=1 Tax=Pseudogracilibacillus sp. SE30717A TaxID=3098293 RepID=UPI00300E0387
MKFDEFIIGQIYKSDMCKLTKEDIIGFAEQFDPQYMHVNEVKANESSFNGIIASGIHTLSISFKLWVELGIYGDDIIAGTGMNNIRFTKPVYPSDKLHVTAKVIGKKELKKDTGIVTVLLTTYNDRNEKVFKGDLSALIRR